MKLEYGDSDSLHKELEQLPPLHLIAFAAACCERIYPNYGIIIREVEQMLPEEPNHLRIALDKIWAYVSGAVVSNATFKQLISDCEGYHYYEDIDNAEVQRALWAIFYTLDSCCNPTVANIILVLQQISETLFEYLDCEFDAKDSNWDKKSHSDKIKVIANNFLTVREISKQSEDLQRLQTSPELDRELVNWLRNSFDNGSRSLLDLS